MFGRTEDTPWGVWWVVYVHAKEGDFKNGIQCAAFRFHKDALKFMCPDCGKPVQPAPEKPAEPEKPCTYSPLERKRCAALLKGNPCRGCLELVKPAEPENGGGG